MTVLAFPAAPGLPVVERPATPEEEANAVASAKEWAEGGKWRMEVRESDRLMHRHIEDIIDKIGTAGLPAATVAAYDAKKTLRAQRP